MIKAKVAFLEALLFFSQSGLFENFSDCSYWLDKSRSSQNNVRNTVPTRAVLKVLFFTYVN